MGRRRHQHSGGLGLASDQIPGLDQNNISLGLVTLSACSPGPSQSSVPMLLQKEEKRQVSGLFPTMLAILVCRRCREGPM